MYGGAGNDTHRHYSTSIGVDTIIEEAVSADTIHFVDATRASLVITRSGSDMVIYTGGDMNDKVVVQGHYSTTFGSNVDYILDATGAKFTPQTL